MANLIDCFWPNLQLRIEELCYKTVLGHVLYKTLRIRNLRQIARLHSKLVPFILSVTNTLAKTNTLAYYGFLKLRIRSVFIVQAPGLIEPITAYVLKI